MKSIIEKLKTVKTKDVIVIGDVMLDEYFFGSVDRISPEAPVPIVKMEKIEWSLGGAANVAANCKAVGFNVDLISLVNHSDRAGQRLISLLKEKDISLSGLVLTNKRSTTCKNRVMAGNHQLMRLDIEQNFIALPEEEKNIIGKINDNIKKDSIVLVSDYSKGVISKDIFQVVLKVAKERNCLVLVDPKGPDFSKYYGANYIKPNENEFNELIAFFNLDIEDSIINNGRKICDSLNLDGLIITLGSKGIQFISKSDSVFIVANKKEVYDLTGAGDTVFAFLCLGFAHGLFVKESLRLASLAASIAISHLKTYSVGLDEVLSELKEVNSKVINDWSELKEKLDFLKKQGKKIVFTNGSFDIIHAGHIYSLQEAKKQGDILVVALNTDDSIKRYKGDTRPINNLLDRAKLIEAIDVVDFVIYFDQDTPVELIKLLCPDVLVKGGDYKKDQIAGGEFVISSGGRVHIVNYQKGYSTTRLVELIKVKELQV